MEESMTSAEPIGKEPAGKLRQNWLRVILFFGLLVVLAATPYFWNLWQEGVVSIPVLPVVLALLVGVGVLGSYLGRSQILDPWVGQVWLGGILLQPILMVVFDTPLAYTIQFLSLLFLVIVGLPFLVMLGGWRKMTAVEILLIFMMPFFLIFVLLDGSSSFKGSFGSCHFLSDLRDQGCVRSVGSGRSGPMLLNSGDEPQLIRAEGRKIWIEPLNRWLAWFDSRAIELDYNVNFLDENSSETLFRGIGLGFEGLRFFGAVQTLISMPAGEIIEEFRLDESGPEEGVSANDFSTMYEPAPSFVYTSDDGCPITSRDGRLSAQYDQDELVVFEGEPGEQLFSLTIDDAACPVFSWDGRYIAVPKNLGENALFIVDTEAGNLAATVAVGEGDLAYLDFSSDGNTLLVTVRSPYWFFWYEGLIFDMEKLVAAD